jgi:TBC domain-containing protein kinase-like protein
MDFPKRLGLGEAQIALSSFVASRHPTESCGHNGLPLTPNSIDIFGRASFLKTLDHDNICVFLVKLSKATY